MDTSASRRPDRDASALVCRARCRGADLLDIGGAGAICAIHPVDFGPPGGVCDDRVRVPDWSGGFPVMVLARDVGGLLSGVGSVLLGHEHLRERRQQSRFALVVEARALEHPPVPLAK